MNLFSKNKDLRIRETVTKARLFQFVIGLFIIAFAYNIFIVPNDLVPGGVGGLAIILNHLFHFQISRVILIINLFLLILSLILLGKEKTRASLLGTILFPLFVSLTEDLNVWLKIDTSHVLLAALFGGIIYGLGAGLVFKAGFTTGGTDIVNQIISKYLKISLGKSMLLSDGLIVLSSAIFFGMNSMMYSIIILYIISLMADKVVLGISDSKSFFIITNKQEKVREFILKEIHHGATIFKAKGGYKKENSEVLMTVLPTKDYYKLKEGIKRIDSDAFYIITDAYEVFGGR